MITKKLPSPNCPVCGSTENIRFNSYKHHCYACYDCNSVFHVKKEGKYFLEYFFPLKILEKIIPRQAYLRLFHAPVGGGMRQAFYDVYAAESLTSDEFRASQLNQLLDQLGLNGIDVTGKKILDISGGPGIVAKGLAALCRRVVVTELSAEAVSAMNKNLGVEAIKFDYLEDRLEDLISCEFDVILIRSSLIFCGDIEKLLTSISNILAPGGVVLVETIIPSLGEVFWWQQMEYKFPIIYSQESIEKNFYKFGFNLIYGYREYGDYMGIKRRCSKTLGRKIFTLLIDFPMMLFYYICAPRGKIPVDQSTRHKFLTQLWRKERGCFPPQEKMRYMVYPSGGDNRSPHFEYVYNGYLKRQSKD
jgi:2-polyprenyl-3-methyl-5-hydroxy-6-metoxy-1,4-benzoquinol methylase